MAKTGPKPTPPDVRFWRYVDRSGDCWLWTGGRRNKHGYGSFYAAGHGGLWRTFAHRYSYFLHHGEVPPVLMHRCDVPACVNPAHLRPGTIAENNRDCAAKGRTRRGERSPNNKLTNGQVNDLRRQRIGGATFRDLSQRFGISVSTAYNIATGRHWRSLPFSIAEQP